MKQDMGDMMLTTVWEQMLYQKLSLCTKTS